MVPDRGNTGQRSGPDHVGRGPLTIAVRHGAICYLDEIVEARQDTTVVIHPLTDDRRVLPLEKRGEPHWREFLSLWK